MEPATNKRMSNDFMKQSWNFRESFTALQARCYLIICVWSFLWSNYTLMSSWCFNFCPVYFTTFTSFRNYSKYSLEDREEGYMAKNYKIYGWVQKLAALYIRNGRCRTVFLTVILGVQWNLRQTTKDYKPSEQL